MYIPEEGVRFYSFSLGVPCETRRENLTCPALRRSARTGSVSRALDRSSFNDGVLFLPL